MKTKTTGMKCVICNETASESVMAVEYKGELYAFCCPYCRTQFVEDIEAEFIESTVHKDAVGV